MYHLLVLKKDLMSTVQDPLLNLTALKDINDEDTIPTIQSTKVTNTANQNMIRRYFTCLYGVLFGTHG